MTRERPARLITNIRTSSNGDVFFELHRGSEEEGREQVSVPPVAAERIATELIEAAEEAKREREARQNEDIR